MNKRTAQTEVAGSRQLQLRQRIKRGVVAGYIHEISVRHQPAGAGVKERRAAALVTSRTG